MSWFLSLLLAGTVSHGFSAEPLHSSPTLHPGPVRSARDLLAMESRRIRSSERRVNALLEEGVRRSPSFADLVARIHRTNVIVYIETTHQLGSETVGRIQLQAVAGGQRYLRMQVRALMQGDFVIAVIAHELHHALEVAADSTVIDDATLTALYQRIGHALHGERGFDTEAARATGFRVRDELIG
jgi:hypothetical protein